MNIRWLGHSCYLITTADGTRILTDPFDDTVGYPVPAVEADIVTVSHNHFDHNNISVVKGSPEVVRERGRRVVRGIEFLGIPTFHDPSGGRERGENTLYKITADGLALLHCGDLGHPLSDDQLAQVGSVDILLVPVGGHYTIDSAQAAELTSRLRPTVVIPMHYKTPATGFPITTADPFIEQVGSARRADSSAVDLTRENLAQHAGVLVLNYG